MKKMIQVLHLLLGGLCLANSFALMNIISFNLGLLLTFLLGLSLFFYGIFYSSLKEMIGQRFWKRLHYFYYSFLIVFLMIISFLSVYGRIDTVDYKEDAIIVLGAGIRGETVTEILQYRLDKAIDYWYKNPNVLIIVSGGQGPGEKISEAAAMERYLISKGIPVNQLIKEEKSSSTYENFVYSKKILDEQLGKSYRIVLITNGFHIYRSSQIAKEVGFSSNHLHADMQGYLILPTYIREFVAVIKMWMFGP
jgi:uncharacterized SAM-binding protein YcdF (DUF218 family)